MAAERERILPGAVALVGSGEYLDVMNDTDRYLLETIGDVNAARVVLMPTASGLEPNGPTSWNALGQKHFQKLGVQDIRASTIIDRESAHNEEQLALLKDADLYYFSGGNPQHVIETLQGTPAWELIVNAYRRGAVLAGCSAGAMMLSGRTISVRQVMMGGQMEFVEAMGIIPHLIVFPHFDRMAGFLNQQRFQQLLHGVPAGYTAIGIDENTALVRLESNVEDGGKGRWQVMGRQSVTVFMHDTQAHVLQPGQEIIL